MKNSRISAGIDIGSRTIELVLIRDNKIAGIDKLLTTFDPEAQCRKLMEGREFDSITATGYGRELFAEKFPHLEADSITEIQAYALGARYLKPETRTVLDIGGQDTKAISLFSGGRVSRFEMNDRCAAGTGRFLELMATSLQIPIEEVGKFAMGAEKEILINSMCTVFAESEVTSLMAGGEKPENIALGIHLSIVGRTIGMLNRVGLNHPLFFAGGVANNPAVVKLLQDKLGMEVYVPLNPDSVGALGAALYNCNKPWFNVGI